MFPRAKNEVLIMGKGKLSDEEMMLITNACRNADAIGAGQLTYSQEAIEDAGYTWTEDHERFVFDVMEE